MAKYTLNLSEVCEQVTGLNFNEMSGMAFDRIDDITNAAIPMLFSTRYNLLDDADDRTDLERMILQHYWEYEICTYTPSDFILRLNRKLNEISPYYNQRYESTKMAFPVFEDVDYRDEGTDGAIDNTLDNGTSNTKHSDKDVSTRAHTGDITNRMDEDGSTTVTGHVDDVTAHTGDIEVNTQESGTTKTVDETDNVVKHTGDVEVTNQESGATVVTGDTLTTQKHTGDQVVTAQESGTTKTVGETDTTQKHTGTVDTSSAEGGTTKAVTDRTETDAGHTAYHDEKNHNNDYKYHTENQKTEWDYRNDTPQGSISGITEEDYLSGYSKHTSEYDGTPMGFSLEVNSSFFDGTSTAFSTDDKNMKKYNVLDNGGSFNTTGTKDTTEGITTIDDTNTVTHGKTDKGTTTYNDTITTNTDDTSTVTHGKGDKTTTDYGDTITTDTDSTNTTQHGKGDNQVTEYGDTVTTEDDKTSTTSHGKGVNEVTEFGDTITKTVDTTDTTDFGKGQTDKTDYNDTITDTMQYGHNIKTDTENNRNFQHDGEYQKHVKGKQNSGRTYAEYMQSYREAMINIYMEIIEELHELFFIIN